jgi:hypothetical protein
MCFITSSLTKYINAQEHRRRELLLGTGLDLPWRNESVDAVMSIAVCDVVIYSQTFSMLSFCLPTRSCFLIRLCIITLPIIDV